MHCGRTPRVRVHFARRSRRRVWAAGPLELPEGARPAVRGPMPPAAHAARGGHAKPRGSGDRGHGATCAWQGRDAVAGEGPRPGLSSAPVEVPAFPVSDWEHYSPIRFLGQGGMGRVFSRGTTGCIARSRLPVRGDEPELARRFILEARAQARVTHPRVCEVYEVGEVQGRAYIAMRYVEDGRCMRRGDAQRRAEGPAEAARGRGGGPPPTARGSPSRHQASNILVEQTAEGALSPFVMDFGLARDWKEGVT